jgi:hypothetical protein
MRRRYVIYLHLAPALGDGFSLAVVNRFSPSLPFPVSADCGLPYWHRTSSFVSNLSTSFFTPNDNDFLTTKIMRH